MRKLLWIDEDTAFGEMMGRRLARWQFDLFRRQSIPEPAAARDYDAIIWDFTFATDNDWQFLDQLRRDPASKNLPVLALLSRELELDERLRLNDYRVPNAPKWLPSGALLQRIQDIFG